MHTFEYLIHYPLVRHAFITGIAIASVCSLLSVIVVLKRMAFIGQGISHAGFGGVGTAILLGLTASWSQGAVVMTFCMGAAVLIGVLSRGKKIEADSAIGILLAGAMAWGVLMTNLASSLQSQPWYINLVGIPEARPSFEQLLFGSLTSVSPSDMWLAVGLGGAVLLTLVLLFKEIVFFAFDETASRVFGVRTGVIYYLLLILLSLTIVLSIRLVGFVLVSALLVIPGATAVMVSKQLGRVLIAALLVGLIGVVGGLVLSLEVGSLSSGACIVGVLCVIFGGVFTGRSILDRQADRA